MPTIDLLPIGIPPPTRLDEVRTSKLIQFGPVLSGIDKQQRDGCLHVSTLGLPEDEHDLTFHGGPDKALHQYCSKHYKFWQSRFEDQSIKGRFVPGGFGENLVAAGFDETNVCIGDIISISHPTGNVEASGAMKATVNKATKESFTSEGSQIVNGRDALPDEHKDSEICLLEVSLPRQPCFKLNQRFELKNFAPQTHQQSKTGWYYRVQHEGKIEAGMEMKIIRRQYPKWSIARLHHYVHRDRTDLVVAEELKSIPALGKECKDVFDRRLAQEEAKSKAKSQDVWTSFRLITKTRETPRIARLELQAIERLSDNKDIPFGSYAVIKLPNGLKRPYSVVEGTTDHLVLGVALDDNSRGGSAYIHKELRIGDTISVGSITRSMEFNGMASHYIFIVGGIGITAYLAMMKRILSINQTFELHYAVRTADDVAFAKQLSTYGPIVRIYDKANGTRMDIDQILRQRLWNSQVFTCGPQRMIDAVVRSAKAVGMTDDEVYYELFTADASGDPFSVEVLARNRKTTLNVAAEESLLQALRQAGFEAGSSCETGQCGTCRISVKDGRIEHRGTGLTEEEQGKEMLSCVSRGIGHITIELEEGPKPVNP